MKHRFTIDQILSSTTNDSKTFILKHKHTKTRSWLSRPGDDCRVNSWESVSRSEATGKNVRRSMCLIKREETDRGKEEGGNWRQTWGLKSRIDAAGLEVSEGGLKWWRQENGSGEESRVGRSAAGCLRKNSFLLKPIKTHYMHLLGLNCITPGLFHMTFWFDKSHNVFSWLSNFRTVPLLVGWWWSLFQAPVDLISVVPWSKNLWSILCDAGSQTWLRPFRPKCHMK